MWIEKLSNGVLRVITPHGPRYIQPSFSQRMYLLWIFRHFQDLPLEVLTERQRQWLENLYAGQQFLARPLEDAPLLGTVERRPVVDVGSLPPRRPSAGVTVPSFVADLQQRN